MEITYVCKSFFARCSKYLLNVKNIGQTMSSCFDGPVSCNNKLLLPRINVIFVETSLPFNLSGRHVKSCRVCRVAEFEIVFYSPKIPSLSLNYILYTAKCSPSEKRLRFKRRKML